MNVRSGATKYVFAATEGAEPQVGTKVCPRCGQVLFDDMDVCYGCLYDFAKDERTRAPARAVPEAAQLPDPLAGAPRQARAPQEPGAALLDAIELDEIDDDPGAMDGTDAGADDKPPVPARHSRQARQSADDTLDLASPELTRVVGARPPAYAVRISSGGLRVCVPVKGTGLSVGRGEENDIVLKARSVSRQHLLLALRDGAVWACDRGATNPTRVGGQPLEGEVRLSPGEVVDVCGTTLELAVVVPDASA